MPKVLVAYASKHGSTAEIAQAIAATLRESGLDVDCLDAGHVPSLDPYEAVVLGSAVYMRRWRPRARHFLRKYAEQLSERPFWIFSSGPCGQPQEAEVEWSEPRRAIARAQLLGMRGHVVFGGCLSMESNGLAGAMAAKCPPRYRDRRDWDQIRAWAQSIAAQLDGVPDTAIAA
jgi:menaquinone-dependent protoporphyrinogen oxidase